MTGSLRAEGCAAGARTGADRQSPPAESPRLLKVPACSPAPPGPVPEVHLCSAPVKGPGVQFVAGCTAQRQYARCEQRCEKSSSKCSVSLDGMPLEILVKIFSYLDAVSLLCTGCVSRRFYHLSNDNFIWIRIYSTAFLPKRRNWKVNSVEETAVSMNLLSVEDKEAGYWKKEYIKKQLAFVKSALAQVLKPVNPDTGLPVKTKEALRISGLGWAIILKEESGKEYFMEHVDLSVNDTSVTVVWYGKNWPCLATLSTLDLCGVTPVFMHRYKTPTKNGPRWYSLITKYNLSCLTESTLIGCDRLIRIFCLNPGLLVGLWKKEEELAFVMASLHFHHLVERSTLGSASIPYELPPHSPFLDDSPEHGLHGYQLHVDMHGGGVFYLCGTFRDLFTKKGYIENGYMKLIVINFKNNREHLPLVGKVGLSWRTNIFDGYVKALQPSQTLNFEPDSVTGRWRCGEGRPTYSCREELFYNGCNSFGRMWETLLVFQFSSLHEICYHTLLRF
ncbi:F-box only protein 15 isoform X3 [Cynocephalus volans]|uniref:F-box only protein 15 isoform X3 n=1 Tax=Cynocephalus volans TaxID=110931 RepID=UPI002FC75979